MVRQGLGRRLSAKRLKSIEPRRGAEGGAYRGADRRGVVAADTASPGRLFAVSGFTLLALVAAVFLGSYYLGDSVSGTARIIEAQLEAAALALALLVAGLCFVRWRLVGDAAVLWLGSAAALYGLTGLSLGYLETLSVVAANEGLLSIQPAGRLVVIALAVRALTCPEVDATLTPSRTMLTAMAATASATIVLQAFPELLPVVAALTDPLGGAVAGTAVVATLWAITAVWSMWVGLHHRRHLLAWSGLLFFSLSFMHLAWLLPATTTATTTPSGGPAALRVVGLVCAVMGATAELARAYVQQGSKLLESVASERSAEARIEVELATQAERSHEAQNALAAIEGATRTLQRYQDQLDPEVRDELAEAVAEEVHRLQDLITQPAIPQAPGRFRLTEGLAAVLTCARSQGMTVRVDVPDHLVAIGHPANTSQVLHNLLQNARRYAGGLARIRATLEGDRVAIRVEDDGPGIPERERDKLFTRGARGSAASEPGSGLGLYISARLMQAQDGELRFESSASGGACFVATLPGFSELSPTQPVAEEPVYESDERLGLVAAGSDTILQFPGDRQWPTGGVEHDDGVRDDVAR